MERERDATDGSHTCEVGGVKEKDLFMFKGSFLDCCFKTHHVLLNSFCSEAEDQTFTLQQQTMVQILKNTAQGCEYVY